MTDRHTIEQRSYNMSRIRSKGTQPERRLLDLLHKLFPASEIVEHPKDLPGTPDAWLPSLGIAVFADGCFFHGCPKHGHIPHANQDYWHAKIKRNKKRAKAVNEALLQLGIQPVRVWEHQLGKDLRTAKQKLRLAARKTKSDFQNALDGAMMVADERVEYE